ncbi:hypothetical protein AgCh_009432 [Apium graveolens]
MQFRKSRNNRSFRKKYTGGEKKSTGRKDGNDSKAGKLDRTKFKCYNCDEPGHFASECKKIKHDKGKRKARSKSNQSKSADRGVRWVHESDEVALTTEPCLSVGANWMAAAEQRGIAAPSPGAIPGKRLGSPKHF